LTRGNARHVEKGEIVLEIYSEETNKGAASIVLAIIYEKFASICV
jgi:hypothetical protein